MPTTIKVSEELRDRLKAQAALHSRTIGEHLAVLADAEDRTARFLALRRQVADTAPEQAESLRAEIAAWDATATDGLPAEDFSDWPGYAAS